MAEGNPTAVNQDLAQLHALLVARNEQLSKSLDTITDADLAQAVVTEMREVVHRIDLTQRLLFTASANRITAAVGKVADASDDLATSLKTIDDVTTLVKSVSGFLTVVDKALDLAKML